MNNFMGWGHLTQNATTRTVKVKGVDTLVTDFTVACNSGSGETRKTEFVRCSVWRDRGARMCQYLLQGRSVLITGSISSKSWTGNDGQTRSQLVMSNPFVEFTDKRPDTPEEEEDIPFEPDPTLE